MKYKLLVGCSLLAAFFTLAATASADQIAIVNASFENPTADPYGTQQVTGWTIGGGGGAGVWNISPGSYGANFFTSGAPDGVQVAYISSAPAPGAPGSLSQTLTADLIANRTYTLSGWVGDPSNPNDNPNQYLATYTVSLFAGNDLLTTLSGTGPLGYFSQFSLSYNSTSAFVGQPLRIVLTSDKAQSSFDAIQLSVPEGGRTVSLLGLAFVGVALLRKKLAVG